jgi:hypothetical protein
MEAGSTSETSVNCYQSTRRNDPEDSHLHTRRHENLKSHLVNLYGEATLCYVRRFDTFIYLMMEAASISETSLNFCQTTWRNDAEDRRLYTRRHENLKSHLVNLCGEATLRYIYLPDDGGSKHLWNIGKLPPDYTAQQPRRQS